MREVIEFRIVEENACLLFGDNEKKRVGDDVRKIHTSPHDPRFERIGQLHREFAEQGDMFFSSWFMRRRYNRVELANASCLQLSILTAFEPPGELCGTEYDESVTCRQCGSGARQLSDLRLDLRKAPKGKHIAQTVAADAEWIVSQQLAERMLDAGLTGFELHPVKHKARYQDDTVLYEHVPSGRELLRRAKSAGAPYPTWRFCLWVNRRKNRTLAELAEGEYFALREAKDKKRHPALPVWYQLVVLPNSTEIVPPTRTGIDPFDEDTEGEFRCPTGDLIGLNLLSEVSIHTASHPGTDLFCSRQFIGNRVGFIRPSRVLFISPRFFQVLNSESVRGIGIEVVHLIRERERTG